MDHERRGVWRGVDHTEFPGVHGCRLGGSEEVSDGGFPRREGGAGDAIGEGDVPRVGYGLAGVFPDAVLSEFYRGAHGLGSHLWWRLSSTGAAIKPCAHVGLGVANGSTELSESGTARCQPPLSQGSDADVAEGCYISFL